MTPNSLDLKDISPELLKYYVFVSTCIQEFRQFFSGQEVHTKGEKEIKQRMKLLKNQIKDYSQEVASLLDLLYSAHEIDWDLI